MHFNRPISRPCVTKNVNAGAAAFRAIFASWGGRIAGYATDEPRRAREFLWKINTTSQISAKSAGMRPRPANWFSNNLHKSQHFMKQLILIFTVYKGVLTQHRGWRSKNFALLRILGRLWPLACSHIRRYALFSKWPNPLQGCDPSVNIFCDTRS